MMLSEHYRTFPSGYLALQNTGAIAAAEYGRVALWTDLLLPEVLSAAFAAAGWCISAADPPQLLTRP